MVRWTCGLVVQARAESAETVGQEFRGVCPRDFPCAVRGVFVYLALPVGRLLAHVQHAVAPHRHGVRIHLHKGRLGLRKVSQPVRDVVGRVALNAPPVRWLGRWVVRRHFQK